tara:strand:+ start:630 stop:938 length:309 start_codon:yes stop_codon:yes gene_type:complete
MKITKRQLRRIIKEEVARVSEQLGTDWEAQTRAVTGDKSDGGERREIERNLGVIDKLVREKYAAYKDGIDDDKALALYVYIEGIRQGLERDTWMDDIMSPGI